MVVPLIVFVIGLLLVLVPVRRSPVAMPTPAEVPPPGGGIPHVAPVDYQVSALRQVIAKLGETVSEFGYSSLKAVLQNHQRTGTDPVYEPLHPITCQEGLARLVELGEIEGSPWSWRIAARTSEPTVTARPALTTGWRYTQVGFEVSTLANIGARGFSHPAYMRLTAERPPSVRIGMLVACGPLGEEPTPEVLRSRFRELLSESFSEMISELTDIRPEARWQSQPGRGRLSLEADLTGDDPAEIPAASAMLFLPESFSGRSMRYAELILHVDLPVKGGEPVIADLPDWHRRFATALALPAALVRFLESLGLTTSDDPPVRFVFQVQARPTAAGMTEIFDVSRLKVMSGGRTSVQFDGWAVATSGGKTAGAVAKSFIRGMCEDLGREGYEEILAGLPE